MSLPYTHLKALSDQRGIFEHAQYRNPRIEHGYCVDDVSRALILIERNKPLDNDVKSLRHTYFHFLRNAQSPDGRFINRCYAGGRWNGAPETTDHWGRGLWALGTVYKHESDYFISAEALWRFEHGARHRSEFLRSMMFASLGAAAILDSNPDNQPAHLLLRDSARMLTKLLDNNVNKYSAWLWPEDRLTYANAIIPEVLLLAGEHLKNSQYVEDGLSLLRWLLEKESTSTHFSVTPTSGKQVDATREIFDQQSIEIAAIVDACSTAHEITGESEWLAYIARGMRWFDGANDSGVMMYDPATGAGFDGLTAEGRNENCGAESTICYLSVLDQYQRYFGVTQ